MFEKHLHYYAALIGYQDLSGKVALFNGIMEVFDELINAGIYYDEFLDIVYPREKDVIPLIDRVRAALEKLTIEIPKDYQGCVYNILRYHFSYYIENNKYIPWAMVAISDDLNWTYEMAEKEKELCELTHEMRELAKYCSCRRDDFCEERWHTFSGEELIGLEEEITQLAVILLKSHP